MKQSYRENLANHSGLEPYADEGNLMGVALGRGNTGQPLSSEITCSVCRSRTSVEKATYSLPLHGKAERDTAESKNRCMRRHSNRVNREILLVSSEHRSLLTVRRADRRTSPTVMLIGTLTGIQMWFQN